MAEEDGRRRKSRVESRNTGMDIDQIVVFRPEEIVGLLDKTLRLATEFHRDGVEIRSGFTNDLCVMRT